MARLIRFLGNSANYTSTVGTCTIIDSHSSPSFHRGTFDANSFEALLAWGLFHVGVLEFRAHSYARLFKTKRSSVAPSELGRERIPQQLSPPLLWRKRSQVMDSVEVMIDKWVTLLPELKQKIFDKLLSGLPFSKHYKFCGVCRAWRAFPLSKQYLLYYHERQWKVFDSTTGLWEALSMPPVSRLGLSFHDREIEDRGPH